MTAIQQTINNFIHHLEAVRRLSPHTVAAYRYDLAKLAAGVGDKTAEEVSAADLRKLIATQRRAKPSSITRLLAAWRAFYEFIIAGGAKITNPVHAVAAPKSPAHLPKALTPDEMTLT